MGLTDDLNQIAVDTQKLHDVVHGIVGELIETDNGDLITVATALNEITQFIPRGSWVTATAYQRKNLVLYDGVLYVTIEDHTSGVFATDFSNNLLAVYQNVNEVSTLEINLGSETEGSGIDLVGNGIKKVNGIADLRLALGANTPIIYLTYHTSADDGGQGVFIWNSSSSEFDNNGTVILPTGHVGNGRWIRQLNGFVTPEMFGGDSSGLVDATDEVVLCASGTDKVYKTTLTDNVDIQADLILSTPERRWSSRRIEGKPLVPPTGITSPILPIYSGGRWHGDKSALSLFPASDGVTYYVDPMLGSDANSGLTELLPLKLPYTALMKADVGEVLIAPTPWPNNDVRLANLAPITTAAHIIIKPWNIRPGRYVSTTAWAHTSASWAPDVSYPTTYKATRSSVENVYDIAGGWDHPVEFIAVESVPACSTRPGTYYTDGTDVWVNPIEGGTPGSNIAVMLTGTNLYWDSDKDLYVLGIDIFGGSSVFIKQSTADIVLVDVRAGLTTGNAYQFETSGQIVLENCSGFYSAYDVYNYHAPVSGIAPNVVEINCDGRDGGRSGSNQISTSHDGTIITRIGGHYTGSGGQVIADVSAGTKSWNVGVDIGISRDISSNNIGLYASDSEAYFYDSYLGDCRYDIVTSNADVYIDRCSVKSYTIAGDIHAYRQE